MQNLIKIHHAVQELDFQTGRNDALRSLVTVLHTSGLTNVKINKFAKFDPNIPCGSRVMSIFTNTHISRALVCDSATLMANKGFFYKLFQVARRTAKAQASLLLYFSYWHNMVTYGVQYDFGSKGQGQIYLDLFYGL